MLSTISINKLKATLTIINEADRRSSSPDHDVAARWLI